MPREFNPLVRKGGFEDAEKFYVLAFEGSITEKKYFSDLRSSIYFNDSGKIEMIPLKRDKRGGNSPIAVKALLSKAKSEYNFRPTDEFWLVIDRDDWERIHKIDLDQVVRDCYKEKNFYMALSNPCFEIWLILHLAKLSDFSDEEKQKIFENKSVSDKKNYVDVVLANLIGDGRGYTKRPNPSVFLPKVFNAIENAECISDKDAPYPKYLGTDVFKLVRKLLREEHESNN